MRKTLAIAALLSGLLLPATTTTATVMVDPLPCQTTGIGNPLCDMQLEEDLAVCDMVQPSSQQGCRAEANWDWAVCLSTTC